MMKLTIRAYTGFATEYFKQAKTPRVLGITASPGGTKEKIQEVAMNLHVTRVEIRTEQSPDVKPYVHPIKVEHHLVELPAEFLKVLALLEGELKQSYVFLKGLGFLDTDTIELVIRKHLVDVFTQVNSVLNHPQGQDLSPFYSAIKIATNAIRLSHAHELLQTQGVAALDGYFTKCEEDVAEGKAKGIKSLRIMLENPVIQEIRSLTARLTRAGIKHPKVTALKDIIRELVTNAPDSRAVVFAPLPRLGLVPRGRIGKCTRDQTIAVRGAGIAGIQGQGHPPEKTN